MNFDARFRKATPGPVHKRFYVLPMVLYLLATGFGAIAAADTTPHQDASDRLRSELRKILRLPVDQKGAHAAHVVDLESGAVLYEDDAEKPLIPASNMKLIVMAAAIDLLGPNYKYQTILAVRDTELVVVGSGDPTFGDERLAEVRGETITAVFQEWARRLIDSGIRRIPGNIAVDDLVFDLKFTHPNWPADQYQLWYEAPVGGLSFNANCVVAAVSPTNPGAPAEIRLVPANALLEIVNKTTTGSKNSVVISRLRESDTFVVSGAVSKPGKLKEVTVRDPGLFFGSVLKRVLTEQGITVGGKVVREQVRLGQGRLPDNCHMIAIDRAPMADALARCGKDSLGMMAEALLKTMGARSSARGTWESGRSAIHGFLRDVGVPADQVVIDDGSGLSRYNRLSTSAVTQVLRRMYNAAPDKFEVFRDSLAVSGTDGTLRKRLRQDDVRGRIYAKTGYLNGVWSLSGFIHTHADRWLAFSFFYNAGGKMTTPKPRMDRACRRLVTWPNGPDAKPRVDG